MDKKQATHFILNQLKLGHDNIQIAAVLSEKLSAPPELALKFVEQVAATIQPPPPSPFTPEPPVASAPVAPLMTDELKTDFEFEPIYSESPEAPISNFSENFHPSDDSQSQVNLNQPAGKQEKEFDIEILTANVVQQLKKHRRHSDIVEYVARTTGWHWNESQRFVARTQTENHSELSQSQNKFMIAFSAVFILGGFLLMGWSVIALFDYAQALTSPGYSTLSFDFFPFILLAFVSSFGIIGGGIFGLYRILTNRQ
jgi:hypothetical protein